MTKLEQKLIELGYKYKEDIYYKYFYSNDNFLIAFIMIIVNEYKVCDYKTVVAPPYAFVKNEHIKTLEKAFNEMQRDLEILKECEK